MANSWSWQVKIKFWPTNLRLNGHDILLDHVHVDKFLAMLKYKFKTKGNQWWVKCLSIVVLERSEGGEEIEICISTAILAFEVLDSI